MAKMRGSPRRRCTGAAAELSKRLRSMGDTLTFSSSTRGIDTVNSLRQCEAALPRRQPPARLLGGGGAGGSDMIFRCVLLMRHFYRYSL